MLVQIIGGEGGIRTPDRLAPMPHFECGAFNHSATSPGAKSGPGPPWSGPCNRRGRLTRQGARARNSQTARRISAAGGPAISGGIRRGGAGKRVGPPYARTHRRSRAASLQCRHTKRAGFAGLRDATLSALAGAKSAATQSWS